MAIKRKAPPKDSPEAIRARMAQQPRDWTALKTTPEWSAKWVYGWFKMRDDRLADVAAQGWMVVNPKNAEDKAGIELPQNLFGDKTNGAAVVHGDQILCKRLRALDEQETIDRRALEGVYLNQQQQEMEEFARTEGAKDVSVTAEEDDEKVQILGEA